jgi:hypothetical protein
MNTYKKSTKSSPLEGWKKAGLIGALVSMLLPTVQPPVYALSGEDPIDGPWHHENVTRKAASTAGFDHLDESKTRDGKKYAKKDTYKAAEVLGWHADYIDSYLYSPIWWAEGGLDRFKVSLATAPELEKLHFDDLFDSDKVRHAWRRYASGTLAGLLWAKENKDVAAAQNIVGVSLHAMQDFYTHSNWIDDPARRDKTFFEIPVADRARMNLFTGAYEHGEHLGVKHHGKVMVACSLFKQPGVREVMSAACGAGSPIGNSDICKQLSECSTGVSVRPPVSGHTLPPNVLFVKPGIAIDNSYTAHLGVQQRGLSQIDGPAALEKVLTLAERQSVQWLKVLEQAMKDAKAEDFWYRVMHEAPEIADREAQFENYEKFPYQFLSAGDFPSTTGSREEYFLRIKLKTGSSMTAGTNSDIKLKVDGREVPAKLDYVPNSNFVLAYNDFERNDEAVYVAGPFNSLPSNITLFNDSATTGDVVKASGLKLLSAAMAPFKMIGSLVTTIVGTNADWIGSTHKVWMPEDLARIGTTPQSFPLEVNGGTKGHYRVGGTIAKVAEGGEGASAWHEFQVKLVKLDCIKESKSDRFSESDEPFVLSMGIALPGAKLQSRTEPFHDVDSGESRMFEHSYRLRVPKDYGMINVPVSFMESDDESKTARDRLLNEFAGKVKAESADEERGFLATISAATAEDWYLSHAQVTAWTRNGIIAVGDVHNAPVGRWIKGRESLTINFNDRGNCRPSGVNTDQLLPYLAPDGTTATPTPTPSTPDITPPTTSTAAQLALLQKFVGKWNTNLGELTFVLDGTTLRGTVRITDQFGRVKTYNAAELRASTAERRVEGMGAWEWTTVFGGPVNLTLSANGDSFTGLYEDKHWTDQQRKFTKPYEWNGTRIKDAVQTPPATTGGTTTGNPTTGTPTTGTPTTGTPTIGGTTGGAVPGGGGPLAGTSTLAGATVKVNKRIYMPGEPITLDVAVPETLAEIAWVGIIPSDVPHGKEGVNDRHDIDFKYMEDRPTRTLTFNAPTKVGSYDFRLNEGTGANGREIATVSFKVQAVTSDNATTITLPKTRFHSGEKFTIGFKVPSFLSHNAWIGVIPADIPHGKEALNDEHDESFKYFEGRIEGQFEMEAPHKPGNYNLRVNDSFGNEIFSTPIITVGAAPEE